MATACGGSARTSRSISSATRAPPCGAGSPERASGSDTRAKGGAHRLVYAPCASTHPHRRSTSPESVSDSAGPRREGAAAPLVRMRGGRRRESRAPSGAEFLTAPRCGCAIRERAGRSTSLAAGPIGRRSRGASRGNSDGFALVTWRARRTRAGRVCARRPACVAAPCRSSDGRSDAFVAAQSWCAAFVARDTGPVHTAAAVGCLRSGSSRNTPAMFFPYPESQGHRAYYVSGRMQPVPP
mgnify:CR=1 FL=1